VRSFVVTAAQDDKYLPLTERTSARQHLASSRAKHEMTLELLMSRIVSLRQVLILLCSIAPFASPAIAQDQQLPPIV